MLAIRDLLAWAPGSLANRENRYNASGSYLFLDSFCSPQPAPRKLTLTGPLCSSQSDKLGISAALINGLRNTSLCFVRHRPSPACAVCRHPAFTVRPTLAVARWGTAKALWCPHGLSARQHPGCFRNSSSRSRAPACSERMARQPSTGGNRSSSPSRTRLIAVAVSLPTFVRSGLLSCDHGLSPGLSTNWENIRIVKERV